MKRITLILIAVISAQTIIAQVSGNVNYQDRVHYLESNIDVGFPSSSDLFISVKGLANVKADSYVAIFSITQFGMTIEEVNSLMDGRIGRALETIGKREGVEAYADMVSFVPMYEYEAQKKIFSKKTYSEIPAGFELKKNLHFKYKDSAHLNEIIAALAEEEIYDLVRVDYFSDSLEDVKKELMTKAMTIVKQKMNTYETVMSVQLDSCEKHLTDGYSVVLPTEMYESYEAYNSTSLDLRKPAVVNKARKATSQYYQPILDKEFDFVVNPVIVEPVIQVLYEVKMNIKRDKPAPIKAGKDYFFITSTGDMKKLDVK